MKFVGFFTMKEMEVRGWTPKLFEVYLPEPHKRVANPYHHGGTIRLYDKALVEAIEQTPKFQEYWHWTNDKFRPRMREVVKKRAEAKLR